MDAAQLGRTETAEVQGDIVRDAAASDVLAASVGGVVTTEDAVANIESAIEIAGTAPLVHSTDNGPAYTSADDEACLARHRIVHLKNVPHTPQRIARGERAFREVKAESGLGRGVELATIDAAAAPCADAGGRLERRAKITSRTAPLAVRYTQDQRDHLYETVRRRLAAVVLDPLDPGAQRMAEREAIHAELEKRGLIRRTRGGAALLPSKAEIKS